MHVYSKNATVMYCTRLPRANALNCVGGETCSSGGIEQVPGCRTCELMDTFGFIHLHWLSSPRVILTNCSQMS